jgi:hypothetical protein
MSTTPANPANPSPGVDLGRDIVGEFGQVLQAPGGGADVDPTIVLNTDNVVFNSPVTFNTANVGTLSLKSQAPNLVFASPDGTAGVPSFRTLTANDIPSIGSIATLKGVGPVINVKDTAYGAVGDGVANDRAAFGAAIAAAISQNRPIYVPAGTYLLTMTTGDRLHVTGNLFILGAGVDCTKLRFGPDSPQFAYDAFGVDANVNLSLIDMEIDGPASVDITKNPGAAITNMIHVSDCSTEGTIYCDRIKCANKFFNGVIADKGTGTGKLIIKLIDCDMSCYKECVNVSTPLNGDRTLHCRNVIFRNAGIPAADNSGSSIGNTITFHPNGNLYIEGCRFDTSLNYAIDMHTPDGTNSAGIFNRISHCYFSPSVAGGIRMSEVGHVEWIGGEYRGGGNIYVPISLACVGVKFDPQSTTFNLLEGVGFTTPQVNLVGCSFTNFFKMAPAYGVWICQNCTALRGVPNTGGTIQVPIQPTGAAVMYVRGGRYYGGDSATQLASAAVKVSGGAAAYIKDVFFDGIYGLANANDAPLQVFGASVLDVERCVFDLTGGTAAIKTDSTTSAGALTGRDNFYKNGLPSIATNAQYLAGRVGLVTAAVTAASSITLNCFSYDRFHITGTTTINTIVPGSAGATLGFSGKVFLHADAAWALGSSGNIKARTASARVVGEVVQLVYDPVTAFWYEVY